jgi:DNA-binding MarR family transcriptional regulator
MDKDIRLLIGIDNAATRLARIQDRCLSLHGISFREFQVLYALSQHPTQCMKRIELAEVMEMSASGITRLLNPMEKIGLLEKEAGARDARVSLVKPSRAGERLLADAVGTLGEKAAELLKSLGREQRQALAVLSQIRF